MDGQAAATAPGAMHLTSRPKAGDVFSCREPIAAIPSPSERLWHARGAAGDIPVLLRWLEPDYPEAFRGTELAAAGSLPERLMP